jgi:hypothetical protein
MVREMDSSTICCIDVGARSLLAMVGLRFHTCLNPATHRMPHHSLQCPAGIGRLCPELRTAQHPRMQAACLHHVHLTGGVKFQLCTWALGRAD